MANKMIILTQHDSGVEIRPNFIDDKKKPINLTGNIVEVMLIYPDLSYREYTAQILDYAQGIASLVLSSTETSQFGLYKTYWKAVDSNGEVTAQDDIFYYVKPVYGGVEVI